VESRLHHCLDITLREDESRVRTPTAARILGTIRRIVRSFANAAVNRARKNNPKSKCNTGTFQSRFKSAHGGRERLHALALMDHPNIANVFDAGATESLHPVSDHLPAATAAQTGPLPSGVGGEGAPRLSAGRPYFVMELVRGVPITEYCDKNHLNSRRRLELFLPVCQAIQHARQKGIIHRDLKPSNVLVTVRDGRPAPMVIDFGIAKATHQKLTEKTLFTNLGQMIGTPVYMSPEQAEMSKLDVDTRSDIYSLGVLLYDLLTGTTPFPEKRLRIAGFAEIQRIIAEEEPERPSTRLTTMDNEQRTTIARNRSMGVSALGRLLRGDLDWIAMKCLEKDRTRRYETANGLEMDIHRHLNNEPIFARPPSAVYRFRKMVRRNKVAFAGAAAVRAALLIGAVGMTGLYFRSERLRKEAQRNLYVANMNLAQQAWEQNNVGRLRQLLQETATYPNRGFEWHCWQRQAHLALKTLRGHLGVVTAVAFSPDSQRVVTGSWDTPAKVWEANSGREMLTLKGHSSNVQAVAFSPDGKKIVTGSYDKMAKLWDATSGRELLTLKGPQRLGPLRGLFPGRPTDSHWRQFNRHQSWDAKGGHELLNLNGQGEGGWYLAFSPDGRRIVTNCDNAAVVWTAASTEQVAAWQKEEQAAAQR